MVLDLYLSTLFPEVARKSITRREEAERPLGGWSGFPGEQRRYKKGKYTIEHDSPCRHGAKRVPKNCI